MKYLTGNQVRQMFLDYFKSKGHMIEPGASKAFCKTANQYDKESDYHERNSSKSLAFLPSYLVFHTPLSSQTHSGVHSDFRHYIPENNHEYTK